MKKKDQKNGFILLPLALGLAGLILLVGGVASFLSFNEITLSAGGSDASKALFYAGAGARDAIRKIAVDRTFPTSTLTYDINFADSNATTACSTLSNGCARVRIETSSLTPKIITSTGYYKNSIRKMQYDVVFEQYGQLLGIIQTEIKSTSVVSTAEASNVASTSATLNGWINPNGIQSRAWFSYTTVEPSVTICNADLIAGWTPADAETNKTGNDPLFYDIDITVQTGQKYYYCAVAGTDASPPANIVYGAIYAFTTP